MLAMARRVFNNFDNRFGERDTMLARVIGVMLMGMVLEATVRLTSLRGRMAKRWSFAGGAFLLLGFWMCVYHITYYDAMFTALPLALLLFVPAHVLTPYFFRRSRLEWDGTGPASDWKMVLSPGNFGLICCPLIVYLLPIIFWDQIGVTLPEAVVEWAWYWPRHVLLGKEMPEVIVPYWLNIPFIVPCFVMLWVWAGWMWLRELPRADGQLKTEDCGASAAAGNPQAASDDPQAAQLANSSWTLAAMSGARMKLSPMRTAWTPAAARRWMSARVRMPLSLTSTQSGGKRGASSSVCSSRVTKVRRSRLLMPTMRAPAARTRGRLAGS
jgi:hypothetical protein